jgi:hypothetical protein
MTGFHWKVGAIQIRAPDQLAIWQLPESSSAPASTPKNSNYNEINTIHFVELSKGYISIYSKVLIVEYFPYKMPKNGYLPFQAEQID